MRDTDTEPTTPNIEPADVRHILETHEVGRTPRWHYVLAFSCAVTMLFHLWVVVELTSMQASGLERGFFSTWMTLLWLPSPIGHVIGLLTIDSRPRLSSLLLTFASLTMLVFMLLGAWLFPPAMLIYLVLVSQNATLAYVTATKHTS